jgi:hypothetical protein
MAREQLVAQDPAAARRLLLSVAGAAAAAEPLPYRWPFLASSCCVPCMVQRIIQEGQWLQDRQCVHGATGAYQMSDSFKEAACFQVWTLMRDWLME